MNAPRSLRRSVLLGLAAVALCGCVKATIDVDKPIKIDMTVDVNVRIQKEVDNSLNYLYGNAAPAPGNSPATNTAPKS